MTEKENKNAVRLAVETLKLNQTAFLGPDTSASAIYTQISRHKAEGTEFSVRKLTAIDSKFTEFVNNIFEIKRKK